MPVSMEALCVRFLGGLIVSSGCGKGQRFTLVPHENAKPNDLTSFRGPEVMLL